MASIVCNAELVHGSAAQVSRVEQSSAVMSAGSRAYMCFMLSAAPGTLCMPRVLRHARWDGCLSHCARASWLASSSIHGQSGSG